MLQTEQSGTASPIFGDRFPYPLDGKTLVLEIVQAFSREFNLTAKQELAKFGEERLAQWQNLEVATAFPTTPQQMPRIAVQRVGMDIRLAGIGGHIESHVAPNGLAVRVFRGNQVQDQIELTVCAINERLRDDLFLWIQQYILDATDWLLPQLTTVYDFRCTNAIDDIVEYQGASLQPGFQFYAGRLNIQVGYDQTILKDVDKLSTIFNWQSINNNPVFPNTISATLH